MKSTLFILALSLLSTSSQASVIPKGVVSFANLDGKKVQYYGGPVIAHAKVYTVFWGSKVNATIKNGMPNFYKAAVDSTYLDWLRVYNTNVNAVDGRMGTNQSIGRGSYAGTITIAPKQLSGTIKDADIQVEIQRQIDAKVLPAPDADTLYMIHFPKGMTITIDDGNGGTASSCQQFCAFHEGFKSPTAGNVFYGVMPDLSAPSCAFGCGGGTLLDRTTEGSSHELMEAITDGFPTPGSSPSFPQAWNTTDGQEVGDICQGNDGKLQAGSTSFVVQQIYDNSANACTTGDYQSNAQL